MKVTINNTELTLPADASIAQALEAKEIPTTGIAVAVNNAVVPKDQWPSTPLADGDRIIIIKAFYGG